MIPALIHRHLTIENINELSEPESDMLLYICNILFPIKPPFSTEDNPHPVTLNIIRSARRESVLDRVKQSESKIKDCGKEIYNSLCVKLGLIQIPTPPIITPTETEQKVEITNGPVTGSNVE